MSKHKAKCPGCGLEGVLNEEQFSGDAKARCGCGHEWTPKAPRKPKRTEPSQESFGTRPKRR